VTSDVRISPGFADGCSSNAGRSRNDGLAHRLSPPVKTPGGQRIHDLAAGFVTARFATAGFVTAGFVTAGFVTAGFVTAGFVTARFVTAGFVTAAFVTAACGTFRTLAAAFTFRFGPTLPGSESLEQFRDLGAVELAVLVGVASLEQPFQTLRQFARLDLAVLVAIEAL